MLNLPNWKQTQKRFEAWWDGSCIVRPMLRVIAEKDAQPVTETHYDSPEAMHMDAKLHVKRCRDSLKNYRYLAEAYPTVEINLGPGSMACYLGSEPMFAWDTVWYKECVENWETFELAYDPENKWLQRHIAEIKYAKEQAGDDYLVTIPDIIENIDILSAMRGPQAMCYDLIDTPELIEEKLHKIDELYFKYYDIFYDIIKGEDGSSQYTAFNIYGQGRVCKVQCDFAALMSPSQFERFIKPSLTKQCEKLDRSVYHLDGKDAIKHIDALMDIGPLTALQWTCGAGQPDGGSEKWYPIYDAVRKAKKSLWIMIYDGGYSDWVRSCDALVARYGPEGLYFNMPVMTEREADSFIDYADTHWSR